MPTLRNKTTDKGAIIRWKPHPRHARPSTYQVTPKAKAFLDSLGYAVPKAGDEVIIPPQVCRPLRLLGDLYFESEEPGDIDLDNKPSSGYYRSSELSEGQLQELRSFVESHPSYIGGFRTELQQELSEVPSGETTPRKSINPDARNISVLSETDIRLPTPFYFGRIDRLSSNQNAMVETRGGKEFNLGRLPKYAVGKSIVCVRYRGVWTMCLVPQLWNSGYRSSVRKFIDKLAELTGISKLDRITDITNRDYNTDIHDTTLNVWVCFAGHGIGVAYHGEWTILVDSELATAGQNLSVKIEAVYNTVAVAVPHRPESADRLEQGEKVTMGVDTIGRNVLVATTQHQFVVVGRHTNCTPDRIKVAITETTDTHVTGSVTELSETDRPTVGETLTIRDGSIDEYPTLPVDVPETPVSQSVPIRLQVTAVNDDGVDVSTAGIVEKQGYDDRTRITGPIQHYSEEGPVLFENGVPIVVSGCRFIPEVAVESRLTGFKDGYLVAEFVDYDLTPTIDGAQQSSQRGNMKLRAGEYTDAIELFVGMVEWTDAATKPQRWVVAIRQEIISIIAQQLSEYGVDSALKILEQRMQDIGGTAEIESAVIEKIQTELSALADVLEAKRLVADADRAADSTAATELKKSAKTKLDTAVSHLNLLHPLWQQESPHWWVNQQVRIVADELLLASSSVSEYLGSIDQP